MVGPYLKVWQVACIGVGPKGEAIVNTFHYGTVTDAAHVLPVNVLNAWSAANMTNFLTLVTDDYTAYALSTLCVKGIDLGQSTAFPNGAGVGTLGAGSAPLTVAVIGRRKGENVGRSSRGRIFISPILATMVDVNGGITYPGGYEAMVHNILTLQITVSGTTFDPVTWNATTKAAWKVVDAVAGPQIGQVRRRRLRLPN